MKTIKAAATRIGFLLTKTGGAPLVGVERQALKLLYEDWLRLNKVAKANAMYEHGGKVKVIK